VLHQKLDIADEELMVRIGQGDRSAFSFLVRRHGLRFRGLAGRMMVDTALAEDIVQEAFVKLWTKPEGFKPEKAKFTTWFHRVVVNRCLDEKRRRMPASLPEGYDSADTRPDPAQHFEKKSGVADLEAALERLPERQGKALRFSYLEGYTNQQAATLMAMNIKAFESLLARARQKLKEELKTVKHDLFTVFE
jgi:RNA polymerase sigma-70 factor (ECF subfamily)